MGLLTDEKAYMPTGKLQFPVELFVDVVRKRV
jgi:hypothetical protein